MRSTRPHSTLLCLFGLLLTSACTSNEAAKARYLESGNQFFDRKDFKNATIQYRNALLKDPRFGDARAKLAEAYERLGDLPNASREFVRAADLAPANDTLQVKAGEYLLISRKFEDAKARALEVIKRSPKDVHAHILLGNALAGLNDLTAALSAMEEAISADPTQSQPLTSVGYLQLARGNRQEAEQAFAGAVNVDGRSMPAYLALANFYLSDNRPTDAEECLKRALAVDPRDVMLNRTLAALYIVSNRRTEAEPHLKTAADVGGLASRLALADYYTMMARDGDARVLLQSLSTDPNAFSAATVRLADIAFRGGHRDEAHAALAEVLRRDPKNVNALITRGRVLLAEKRVPEAIADIKAGVSADSRSLAAHVLLAEAYRTAFDFDAAIKEYNEVLKLNPRSGVAQYELARLHLVTGRTETSIQFAEQAIKAEPRSVMARLVFGRALTAHREFSRAESELRGLQQHAPEMAVIRAALGTLLLAKGDVEGARRELAAAIALDAANIEATAGLVQIDMLARRFPEVRQRLGARVAMSPDDLDVLVFAANGYVLAGDSVTAEALLRKVTDRDPARLTAYVMLGRLYFSQNRLDEARQRFQAVVSRKPDSTGASTLLGMILQMQGKNAEAEQAYQQAVDSDPYAAVAANNLAWLYAGAGKNLDIALQLAQTAKSRLTDEPNVNDTLGWIYYKKGLFRQAVAAFKQSIVRDPANAEFHFHLGLAHLSAGDPVEAKTALSNALRLDPKFKGAEEARRALEGLGA